MFGFSADTATFPSTSEDRHKNKVMIFETMFFLIIAKKPLVIGIDPLYIRVSKKVARHHQDTNEPAFG